MALLEWYIQSFDPFTLAFLMGGTYNPLATRSNHGDGRAFTLAFLMGGTYNARFLYCQAMGFGFHSSLSDGRDLQSQREPADHGLQHLSL